MRPHSYLGEGLILRRRNFGEADRIISLYTKSHGRISLLAKGIRRPKSRKRGHVEIFSLVKFQAVSGRGIDLMTEVEMTVDYTTIRTSLPKISLAYYFMEVIDKITHEGEPNLDLYNLLLDFLSDLNSKNNLKKMRMDFIFKLLILMGYWPDKTKMENHDEILKEIIERHLYSERVGKRVLAK